MAQDDQLRQLVYNRILLEFAREAQYELTERDVEAYNSIALIHGFDAAIAALKSIDTRGRMPTTIQILQALERLGSMNQKTNPNLIANDLLTAISKFGRYWPMNRGAKFEGEFKAIYGELAWEVMRRFGGWPALVEQSDVSDLNILRAQIRDCAMAVEDQRRARPEAQMKSLGPPSDEVRALIGQLSEGMMKLA